MEDVRAGSLDHVVRVMVVEEVFDRILTDPRRSHFDVPTLAAKPAIIGL
jgi:hypothetical protein